MADDRFVRRSGDDYTEAFAALLPTGAAWPREPDSVLMKLLGGMSQIWGNPVDRNAGDLLEIETDPRITNLMLEDWERNWGLPDPCFLSPKSFDQRHEMLLRKMTIEGGQSREFFISVAQDLGYPIQIFEFAPYMAGVSQVGDIPDEMGGPRWELGPIEMRFFWSVNAAAMALHWLRAGSGECGVDHHLEIEVADDLECIFKRWKPAHTLIVFDYSAVDNTAYYADLDFPELIQQVSSFTQVSGHGNAFIADFVVGSPVIGIPVLNGKIGAVGITVGSLTFTLPTINKNVLAAAVNVAVGSPVMIHPTAGPISSGSLAAAGIVVGSPVIGQASMTPNARRLNVAPLAIGVPVLTQNQNLSAVGFAAFTVGPVVDVQTGSIATATSITVSSPSFGTPVIVSLIVQTPTSLTAASPQVDATPAFTAYP